MNPADGEEHVLVGRAGSQGMRFSAVFVPLAHLGAIADAEGLPRQPDLRMATWPNDATLQNSLRVLVSAGVDDDADHDEAARSLVLRVATLMGEKPPEWTADDSGFSPCRLAHAALDLGFSSHSHFTRLFTRTTGMTPTHYQQQFRRVVE